jgi:hypothetical protein
MLPATLIVEGGLIAYESNVRTGGKGANYLGIGANSTYRIDQVTVSLRLVDARTGQILSVVTVTKTIYSYQFSASVYKFVAYQHLLQGETGFTSNEPIQLGVRQALEAAVIQLTLQGVRDRYLEFAREQDIDEPLVQKYLQADFDNANEPETVKQERIGYRNLPTESHSGMVLPMVLSPAPKTSVQSKPPQSTTTTKPTPAPTSAPPPAGNTQSRPAPNMPSRPTPAAQESSIMDPQ